MLVDAPTLKDVFIARKRVHGIARKTPLIASRELSRLAGRPVMLKLENLQETGSFKVRGAASKLLALSGEERKRGVIAFSTGNHGRAVAFVAQKLGIRATVCLSNRVPEYRVDAMRALGAEVVQHGASQDEAYRKALEVQRDRGLTMVAPFDDPWVIAGQGTIGLEILEGAPEVDTVVIPISGGGLAAGVALVMKRANPAIRVIGVSMEVAPAMYRSLQAGKPVEIEEKDSLADALLGGIALDNRYTFRMVRDLVDDMVLVSEEEIAAGMFHALDRERQVVEGAGAVGIAALLRCKIPDLGRCVVVVVSGGNIEAKSYLSTLEAAAR
ncbi:hydroxyectoine utilization dehydratase EutB [Deferrisoma palaeochoriense]